MANESVTTAQVIPFPAPRKCAVPDHSVKPASFGKLILAHGRWCETQEDRIVRTMRELEEERELSGLPSLPPNALRRCAVLIEAVSDRMRDGERRGRRDQ